MHLTVFLWGFTAVLGKAISLPAVALVWYRLALVVGMLGVVQVARGRPVLLPRARALRYLGIGVLVGLHWLFFYGTIKVAGVALAVLCLSTITFFTALFEPVFFGRPARPGELLLGLGVVGGVGLLVTTELSATPLGLALGMASALASALFGTLNGVQAGREPAEQVTLYELAAALAVTTGAWAVLPGEVVWPPDVSPRDWGLLLALSFFCTVLPWLWSLSVLEVLTPYTLALAVSLEPVYALALAYVWFPDSEALSARFYVGAAALVGLVLLNGALKRPPASPPTASVLQE
jgi:drug/metabolite transporter (DMT)-like permease